MITMDATGTGIALGLIVALAYALTRAVRQRSFDLGITVLVFLAVFSFPGAMALIRAGLLGAAAALPSNWREHVAIAGIVTVGLGLHYVIQAFRSAVESIVKPQVVASREATRDQVSESVL